VGATHHSKYSNQYLSLSALNSSGFMYNTAVSNAKVFYSNDLHLPHGHNVNLQLAYVNNAFGANGFYAYPYDKNSTEKVNTLWATLDHDKRLNEKWNIRSNVSLRRNTDDYIFIKSNPSYYHNVHKSLSTNLNVNAIYTHKMGEFALGLNSNYQQINSNNLGKNERFNNGLFAENSFRYKSFNASAGLYTNYNSAWGFSVLPGIDIGYAPTVNIRLFASAGSANRIPTYTDLYYKGPSNIGNSELQPERSYGLDAGAKYESAKCQLSASVFHRKVSNLIDWTKDKNATIWQPSNFGLQTIQGVQVMTRFLFSKKEVVYLKDLSGKYQFINSGIVNTLQQTDSKYALDYFRHQAIGAATVSVYDHLLITLSARYQYRFNYHDYTLLDARVAYAGKRIQVYADVNNLLNTTYHESNAQPMPSRWFNAGASFRFAY
jgi:iron complex outermembrane receptor protein